jgi:succinate dehydrogenase / fumarate reductase cytochrome b subunit
VTTLASRTLRWGGVFLLVFIVLHVLHFTTLDLDPSFVELDVFGNVLKAFDSPWMVAFYTVAMLLLGFHLFHGVWSSGRTLGVSKPSPAPLKRRIALILALVIALGFAAVPLAVWFGVVP